MQLYIILAAAASTSGTENYPYILALLALVLSIVALIQVSTVKRDLNSSATPASRQASAVSAPTSKPSSAVSAAGGIAPEIVAVIAAAVHSSMGMDYQVVTIKPQDTNWGQAGRQSVLSSHKIR